MHKARLHWFSSLHCHGSPHTYRVELNVFASAMLPLLSLTVILGPILFSLYISPIADLVLQYGVSLQQYADDAQLYIACFVNDAASSLSTLESCLASLHSWFCHNGLALNASKCKSEAIIFGQRMMPFSMTLKGP